MNKKYAILFVLCLTFVVCCVNDNLRNYPESLEKSNVNSHLLETISGNPVFLNNFTLWKLIEHGTRQDAEEILSICKENKYNMVSSMILGIATWKGMAYEAGVTSYGDHAFENDASGYPNPLEPIVTSGNDFNDPEQYDFWDHVEYIIDLAAKKGMYIGLHPAWGNWFSGYVHGQKPEDIMLFDEFKAYKYGQWLGQKFGNKKKCNLDARWGSIGNLRFKDKVVYSN